MTDETQNLVLEILKALQARFSRMEDRFAKFEDQLNGFSAALLVTRLDIHAVRTDIQSARGEVLELLKGQAQLHTDVERLKAHTGLPDELHS